MNSYAAVPAPAGRQAKPSVGLALPGFEHVSRFFDPSIQRPIAKILPGEFYVSRTSEAISTVLGSCVAACIRDNENGVGGMNHFMLPAPTGVERDRWWLSTERAARYGNDAMEQLINAILKAGGRRERLEVKIFGGARAISDVGQRNIEFVRHYLETEGLRLVAENVGDNCPRLVQFFPDSGRARMRRLRSMENSDLRTRENVYLKQLAKDPIQGEVELF